jgi:D-beta-D-heptose 7-phosphate kinase/D-beta-D-heptose 1-phosphate adenosyltransferase
MMKNAKKIIADFSKAKILVVGDLILDEYIKGDVERISPEAPVPVVRVKDHFHVPGGAANVAGNLASFGASVTLAGVVGNDKNREILLEELRKRDINTAAVVEEKGRRTTLKSRVIARNQQVVRVDWEDVYNLQRQTRDKLQDFIRSRIKGFDAVIVEDYGKGVIDKFLLNIIISEANKHKKIITVDPKEEHFELYKKVTAITPNRKEAQNALRDLKMKDDKNAFKIYNDELVTDGDIKKAGNALMEHLELESLLLTLGEHGMELFEKGKEPRHIPTVAQNVFDVSGAGDTAIATFTLGLCAGASKLEAAMIANYAAGIVVGKVGTATITRQELIDRIER